MAQVDFELEVIFPFTALDLWRAMTDWRDHARWIPATKVWITKPGVGVGVEFVARSGLAPLAVNDRMRVIESDPTTMSAKVEKFGRPLKGTAGFSIESLGESSKLIWFEKIDVEYLPNFLSAPLTFATRILFKVAMWNLKRVGLKPRTPYTEPTTKFASRLLETPQFYGLNIEVQSHEEFDNPVIERFLEALLTTASSHPVTQTRIRYSKNAMLTRMEISIKTADRLTAHNLIEEFAPIKHKHTLQSQGGDLESVHNRFGTVDFVVVAPNSSKG